MRLVYAVVLRLGLAAPLAGQVPAIPPARLPLDSIIHLITDKYRIPISSDSLYHVALGGILKTLDPYSRYYSPAELKIFREQLAGSIGGIGAIIDFDSTGHRWWFKGFTVASPAHSAGAETGDTIVAVGRRPVKGASLDDILSYLKGPPGSVVYLTVHRAGETRPIEIQVTRAVIEFSSVNGVCRQRGEWQYLLAPGSRVAYLELTNFARNSPIELDSALSAIARTGATGLVLDLRDNPGGILESSVAMADMFLDTGRIVTTQERGEADSVILAKAGALTKVPVVILVNENTISAAELFVASLQDNHRAIVVGSRTFGKGVYQQVYDLPDSGAFRLTPGAYVRPSGVPIERHAPGADSVRGGVWPDSGMGIDLTPSEKEQFEQRIFSRASQVPIEGQLTCPAPPVDDRAIRRAIEVLSVKPHS
ncbi:MAG: S41 family peptidase [Gemmatimonadota bacterium]